MSKRNANYVHYANWSVSTDYREPVVVLVTWWEPEVGSQTFFYDNAAHAAQALSLPMWNQQFMSELDDEWEIHDDIVVRVMAF